MTNKITILISLLCIIIVFSGCSLVEKKEIVEKGDSQDNGLNNEAQIENKNTDTYNWQVYRNEEYGFEIKYPSSWIKISTESNLYNIIGFREKKIIPGDSEYSRIYIDIKDNSNRLTLKEYYKKMSEFSDVGLPNYFEINDVKNITIDGIECVQFPIIPGAISNKMTSILYDKKIIEINKHNDNNESIDEIYDLMLETIKFLNK